MQNSHSISIKAPSSFARNCIPAERDSISILPKSGTFPAYRLSRVQRPTENERNPPDTISLARSINLILSHIALPQHRTFPCIPGLDLEKLGGGVKRYQWKSIIQNCTILLSSTDGPPHDVGVAKCPGPKPRAGFMS